MDEYGELVSEFGHYLVIKWLTFFLKFINMFNHDCKGLNIIVLDLDHFDIHLFSLIYNHKGILVVLRPNLDFFSAFEDVDFDVFQHWLIEEYLLSGFDYFISLIPTFLVHFLNDFSQTQLRVGPFKDNLVESLSHQILDPTVLINNFQLTVFLLQE